MKLLDLIPVDVYDVMAGVTRERAIAELLSCAKDSGRESWADFNGTMLIANPDDTADDVEKQWQAARRRT